MFKNLSPAVLGVSGRESEVIELALSHGFKGLDLSLVEFAQQVRDQGMARAARLLTSARLKLGSFPLPVRWQHDSPDYQADLQQLAELAAVAREAGCQRAVTTIEPASDERVYHENFEFHRRRLAELADLLAEDGIRLGVGFVAPHRCREDRAYQFMQTADEVLMLLGTVASPHIGLALDTWHWHLGGGTIQHLRSLAADKIVSVSLGDAEPGLTAANAESATRRLPGDGGAVDNAGVLAALAELGYHGPVTPTADPSQFAGQSRDQIVKSTAAAFDAVWKAAGLNQAGRRVAVGGR
jgi:sugar phosphate isomerase/epimerase